MSLEICYLSVSEKIITLIVLKWSLTQKKSTCETNIRLGLLFLKIRTCPARYLLSQKIIYGHPGKKH